MHGVRQQMDSLFSSLFAPNPGFFPNRQFFPRPFFPSVPTDSSAEQEDGLDFDQLPNNYKNSTSETKVVDGQVIQVNKTVHKISGDNSNGFFQFSVSNGLIASCTHDSCIILFNDWKYSVRPQVIKIRPSDSPLTEEKPQEAANNVPPAAIETTEDKHRESTTVKAQQEADLNNPSLNEVIDQEEKVSTVKPGAGVDDGLL